MAFKTSILVLTLSLGHVIADKVKYTGHKVFRITPKNEHDVEVVTNLETQGLSFWDGPNRQKNRSSDVMVPPEMLHIIDSLRGQGLTVSELISDVQSRVDQISGNILTPRTKGEGFAFDHYHTFEDIIGWVKEQASVHSDIASAFSVGESYEGRELLVLKISTPSDVPKRAIWLDSNIHAREWITSAVSVYIVNELLNGNNAIYKSWIQDYDWYILPVLNPDGFVYSYSTDPMWRKTRSINPQNLRCPGTDPNRNWDFHWTDGGSSSDPCVELYAGPAPFSEVETRLTSEFISTIAADLDAFISLHSYGQVFLIPYGFNGTFPRHDFHLKVGQRAAEAITEVHGTKFFADNIVKVFSLASGGSIDWVAGVHEVPLVYAIELRDKGEFGFLLPEDQIVPSAQELLEGLNAIVVALRNEIIHTTVCKCECK